MTARSGAFSGESVGAGRFLTVFGWMWAWAALFHVVGNGHLDDAVTGEPVGVATAVVAIVALAVLWRPVPSLAALLGTAILASALLEAPVLGNHWFIAAVVSIPLVIAVVSSRAAPYETARRFVPGARVIFLIAYGAAAFAKLNTAFFDPAVSCASFYSEQLLGSWGVAMPSGDVVRYAVITGTVLVELAIPGLLLVRRTRHLGIWLGVVFHGLIALDLAQHFWDFSSILYALFALFAAQPVIDRAVAAVSSRRVRLAAVLLWPPVLLSVVTPVNEVPWVLGRGWTHLLWLAYLAAAVWTLLGAERPWRLAAPTAIQEFERPRGAWVLVPVLVALNAVAPYLELKTAFSFTMYSNLHVAGGESNHLIVPRSVDVADRHEGLVEVLASEDPVLARYIGTGYLLPSTNFRHRLSTAPSARTVYRQDGERHVWQGGDTGPPVSDLLRRAAPLRAVDASRPVRCQTSWLPAH